MKARQYSCLALQSACAELQYNHASPVDSLAVSPLSMLSKPRFLSSSANRSSIDLSVMVQRKHEVLSVMLLCLVQRLTWGELG
jgi:hypothetical protein